MSEVYTDSEDDVRNDASNNDDNNGKGEQKCFHTTIVVVMKYCTFA